MHSPKWAIFYDFHTMPAQPDVGERFDADAFTDKLKSCHVDYVVFHARCNLGMAYYDTKVGIRHPSLKFDLFGRLAEACKRKDIALTAYFNVGLSHEEGSRRRDWCVLTPEGYTYRPNRMDHFMRLMCYNTGYCDHLLAMIREVVTAYPVAGFFLDCMHAAPCVGVECIREMKQRGIDWQDSQQAADFGRFSQVRIAKKIRDAALAIKPDLLLYFNGVNFEDQQDIGTYLEFECLPTGGWGYESLPAYSRYARTLGKQVLNMTGRFHRSWGDFGGIRTEPSLEYDCIYGLANGLRATIGDHWHPRGEINHAVFDLVKRIYDRLQTLEPYIDGATPECDVAVVAARPPLGQEVLGAVRLLAELKVQFDVVTAKSQWKDYRLLIIPDTIVLDDTLAAKVREHLANGGAVIASAWAGLDAARKKFVLDDWGVSYHGEDEDVNKRWEAGGPSSFGLPVPGYFSVARQISTGLPDMPLNCYERGAKVEAAAGTTVLGHVWSSYFPRYWDGEHHHLYIPPDRETERPFVTRRGAVAYISHPVFGSYHRYAPVPLKQLIGNLIGLLHPKPLVRTGNLPSFARVSVTAQPKRRMVYVMGYVPERRGAMVDMIEEPIHMPDVSVSLRLDGAKPGKVYLAPSRTELPVTVQDGYASVTLPTVKGWSVVVFEE
ncbi:MAG: hypothetical protein A3K18_29900 [Lentisphaerae bacterium RIFOXYA12_64_32]|nr:MAG: hypothetical protein A3K18_29900 [Lentisphaerae bacterium RIFOXYA12_64_32]